MSSLTEYTVILLAAGVGSRISDLTTEPKCLLQFNGKSILELHLESFIYCGIKKVVIVLGYKENLIRKVVSRYQSKINIHLIFNEHYASMGNTYSLYCGLNIIRTPVMILDADLVYDREILKNFVTNDLDNQVLVGKCAVNDVECSKVLIDSQNIVQQFADKRTITAEELSKYCLAGEAIGVLKFSKNYSLKLVRLCRVFLRDPENKNSNWEKLLNLFITNHQLNIYRTLNEKWIEIDTVQDFERAKELFS